MLIQFTTSNFKSIQKPQTLSLVKSKGSDTLSNSFEIAAQMSLLRSIAIYGPNASGKSNILKAMQLMTKLVLSSAKDLQRGEKIAVQPFKLCSDCLKKPSEFEIVFLAKGIKYQYGFTVTSDQVMDEWLIAFPKGRPQRWFEREWDEENQVHKWKMGEALTGEKQIWQKSTRSNSLFLSMAVNLNSVQLKPIFDWFKDQFQLINVDGINEIFTAKMLDAEGHEEIMKYMRAADIGMSSLYLEKQHYEIKTLHTNLAGETVQFDIEEESLGTQKLLQFVGPWIDSLRNGFTLVIDELHDKLHPKIVQFLVDLFNNEKTNPHNAQLIFTTHDTTLLNQKTLRRDQIYFVEKSQQGASALYSLSDFKVRKNFENIETSYLLGRYGAIPYIDLSEIEGSFGN